MQNHSKQVLAIHDLHALVKPEICQVQNLLINLFWTISTSLKGLKLDIYFWKKSVQDGINSLEFITYLNSTLSFFWNGLLLKECRWTSYFKLKQWECRSVHDYMFP